MIILGLDPGPTITGFVFWDTDLKAVIHSGNPENIGLFDSIRAIKENGIPCDAIASEMIENFGSANNTLYETCLVIGQFKEIAYNVGLPFYLIPRRVVKSEIVGKQKANDSVVRTRLITDFGEIENLRGKQRGALAGVTKHAWSALGVAITSHQLLIQERIDHATGRTIAKTVRKGGSSKAAKRSKSRA